MPGLVDCHIHPSQFFKDGVDYSSFVELLVDAFFPGSVMFENTTYAREESMKIVVCGVLVCPLIDNNTLHCYMIYVASFHLHILLS